MTREEIRQPATQIPTKFKIEKDCCGASLITATHKVV